MGYGDLRKGRYSAPGQEYLVTTVCAERKPIFHDQESAQRVIDELGRPDMVTNVDWLTWVLMPDHFHGLVRLTGQWSLADTMKRLKGRSARAIGQPAWQPAYHDHALRDDEDRLSVARYVLANPVRAGLVDSLRNHPFWYCCWLEPGDDPDEFLER